MVSSGDFPLVRAPSSVVEHVTFNRAYHCFVLAKTLEIPTGVDESARRPRCNDYTDCTAFTHDRDRIGDSSGALGIAPRDDRMWLSRNQPITLFPTEDIPQTRSYLINGCVNEPATAPWIGHTARLLITNRVLKPAMSGTGFVVNLLSGVRCGRSQARQSAHVLNRASSRAVPVAQ